LDGSRAGVASFDTPKAVGEPLGRVERTGCDRTGNRWFTIGSGTAGRGIAGPGDGICFLSGGELLGTNINRVEGERIYPNKCEALTPGVEVFRNHDHAFARALERSRTRRRIVVGAGIETTPSGVEITFKDETGLAVTVSREGPFEPARDQAKMAATIREQLAKSGDTIFDVRRVEVSPEMPFIPVSTLAAMRREGLERLFEVRSRMIPERRPAREEPAVSWPRANLAADENVTNRLAEKFWRDHGVTAIEPPMEFRPPAAGDPLMRTRYCLRREIGECLREGSALKGDLFLERGATRLRLDFDCNNCEMTIKKI
jgi:putative protease